LQLVRQQIAKGDTAVTEEEIRDVSLYEFWWKYCVYKGRVKKSTRPVCLMVTPCFSADCANVEHPHHEGYARAAVIAYWRHMAKARRHEMILQEMAKTNVTALPTACFGATDLVQPPANAVAPEEDRYLGVRDLYWKFEGVRDRRGADEGWGLALMEMLSDPMLRQWVPAWVVEQYERANPFYKEVLTVLLGQEIEKNKALLKQTKREMIRRYRKHLWKAAKKVKNGQATSSDEEDKGVSGESDADSQADADKQADDLAAKLAGDLNDDPNAERIEIEREPRPTAGGLAQGGEEDASWAQRSAEERLSAAGAAAQAPDRVAGQGLGSTTGDRDRSFGVVFNPKGYPWTKDECNVHWSEEKRLLELRDKWYGKAFVGDGADIVRREDLDPMQRFAHDIVMDPRHSATAPLRLMMLGSAGTGKSRTVRSFVSSRRQRIRRDWEGQLLRAQLGARAKAESRAARAEVRLPAARTLCKMLRRCWACLRTKQRPSQRRLMLRGSAALVFVGEVPLWRSSPLW
jgi:hypothetical protein